jgi:hypothetical protein
VITPRFLRNVMIKGVILFALFNLVWAALNPQGLGSVSAYNLLFRGRERLPFGEDPGHAYNFSLYNLDAMFASLRLAGSPKPADEFRVLVVGDSATWGTLLRPEETLAGQLDALYLKSSDGRTIRAYNLGYPTLSLVKDLVLLDRAMKFEPDLILWPLTLESFPRGRQLESPIVANNPEVVTDLIQRFSLNLPLPNTSSIYWSRTLIGQRRELADLLRLQLYGVPWSATGIDQVYPTEYEPAALDLEADRAFGDWQTPSIPTDGLALDVLAAGVKIAGEVPVVVINEPMLVSEGANSDLRYNFYYPRWVYDQYRFELYHACTINGWTCLDLWDAVPQERFTNSAIHMDSLGVEMMLERIIESGIVR